ncbi:MAG: hypothetical protein IT450_01805 [Phycisphaerales bacterium]|nr:hypothetical protein [Phycisphaerales bacterium]
MPARYQLRPAATALAALFVTAALAQSRPVTLPASHPATQTAVSPIPHPTLWFPAPRAFEELQAKALDQPLDAVDFTNTPLAAAIDSIKAQAEIPIGVDWGAINDLGIDRETPISYRVRDLELRHVLDAICEVLRPDGALTMAYDSLRITTRTQAEKPERTLTRCYPVGDLLEFDIRWRQRFGQWENDAMTRSYLAQNGQQWLEIDREYIDLSQLASESLQRIMSQGVSPDSWEVNGGVGSFQLFGSTMVVRATHAVHAEIVGLLRSLRRAVADTNSHDPAGLAASRPLATWPATQLATRYPVHHPAYCDRSASQSRFAEILGRPFDAPTCIFDPALDNVIDAFSGGIGIPVIVHWDDLSDAGIDSDKPITIIARTLNGERYLRLILDEAGGVEVRLFAQIRPTGIHISRELGTLAETRIYAVTDLLFAEAAWWERLPSPTSKPATRPGSQPVDGIPFICSGHSTNYSITVSLELLLTNSLAPDEWEVNGGVGSITGLGPLLIVRKRYPVGGDPIEEFLDALSASLQVDSNGGG